MVTKKIIVIVYALLLIVVNLPAQSDSSNMSVDPDQVTLVGKCNRLELQNDDLDNNFFEEYRSYNPDTEVLEDIKNKIYNCSVTIVLGTWCHDSQIQVPRFIKILDVLDYNTNYIKLICVDKNKKAGNSDITALEIDKVPTFIFYKKNKEVGRIVETPVNTLELDTYYILEK
jgi:hypothetical protein